MPQESHLQSGNRVLSLVLTNTVPNKIRDPLYLTLTIDSCNVREYSYNPTVINPERRHFIAGITYFLF